MAVKVYERILQLFEAEGIKTLFGGSSGFATESGAEGGVIDQFL